MSGAATLRGASVKPWKNVRNIFKILGYCKRNNTQKSIGKEKFTCAEGCTPGSLGGMHTGREVHRGFIRCYAVLLLPLDWAGFGLTVYAVG
jgi:hypothetical protein